MNSFIDPAYLRCICDGLQNNSLDKENLSSLPDGLIGLYEETFETSTPISERKKTLAFFTVWAILKKEASVALVGKILNWQETEVLNQISNFSKWFNSSIGGKYQLYHERFRIYILEKISYSAFEKCNNQIIALCQSAIALQSNDELEEYALEYLSAHFYTNAMLSGNGGELLKLAYNTTHWNRQIEVSKGFEWSKRMLQYTMEWATKYDDEEVIECALNKVDLHHLEQNDAPRIVELVANNDMETALQRIEAFGGNDKDGLQRKFILYMLCLMELTLLESKYKPFRRDAIEKLLKHLDEHLPVDHSVLNWDDFFPSYLMFQMACEWAEMGLDFKGVFRRVNPNQNENLKLNKTRSNFISYFLAKEWFLEIDYFRDIHFHVLQEIIKEINIENFKNNALFIISTQFAKKGKTEKALEKARCISDKGDKSNALNIIATELSKQGKLGLSALVLKESLEIAREIINSNIKSKALAGVIGELARQGNVEEAFENARVISNESDKVFILLDISIKLAKENNFKLAFLFLKESIINARNISDDSNKSYALICIATELSKQGDLKESSILVQESLAIARRIKMKKYKINSLIHISNELTKIGYFEEASLVLKETFEIASVISDEYYKIEALSKISNQMAKHGQVLEALELARIIENEVNKIGSFAVIITKLMLQGNKEGALLVLQEALEIIDEIKDNEHKFDAIIVIAIELAVNGNFEKVIEIAKNKNYVKDNNRFYYLISKELTLKGKLLESFDFVLSNSSKILKNDAFHGIATELIKLGQLNKFETLLYKSLETNKGISEELIIHHLIQISEVLSKRGNLLGWPILIKEVLKILQGFNEENVSSTIHRIASEMAKNGNKIQKIFVFNEVYEIIRRFNNEHIKVDSLMKLSTIMAKHTLMDIAKVVLQEAHEIIQHFGFGEKKNNALCSLSTEMAKQGRFEEAFEIAQNIKYYMWDSKSIALHNIAIEMAKQSKFDDALDSVSKIIDESNKCNALSSIALELSKQGKIEEAFEILNRVNNNNYYKFEALASISSELSKQGKIEEALEILNRFNEKYYKFESLARISSELSKQGKLDKAIEILNGIKDYNYVLKTLVSISNELTMQGSTGQSLKVLHIAIEIIQGISNETDANNALSAISIALAKNGNWNIIEQKILKITKTALRQECWEKIASESIATYGWQIALQNLKKLQNQEASLFYLNGWVKEIKHNEINKVFMKQAIFFLKNDSENLEVLLQLFAQNELFFGNPSKEKINRLNKTLNIQWALDINASFPMDKNIIYFSNNLVDWIDQIVDETDRIQIFIWAKQVAYGEMNQIEFEEKIKGFN